MKSTTVFQEQIIDSLKKILPKDMFYSKLPLDTEVQFKELLEEGEPLPSCHHFHDNDCMIPQYVKMINVFKQTARLYFLSHLIPLLLFKRKALKKHPIRTILKLIWGWLRSMAFISNYGILCRRAWCSVITNNQISVKWFTIWSIAASSGILFEAPGRRAEICMYVVPRWLEALPKFLSKRALLPEIKLAPNILLALGIAWITGCYFTDEGSIKSHLRWLTSCILGAQLEETKPTHLTLQVPKDQA
jgi:hypothetical protein